MKEFFGNLVSSFSYNKKKIGIFCLIGFGIGFIGSLTYQLFKKLS
jgi:H+/Cl- antiporter ClcA